MKTPAPLYLIDSYGLIYRSYFAFMARPLRNARGANVSALFGFFRSLVTLLDEGAPTPRGLERPRRLAAIFDPRGPTFRHEMYPEYKANRQKTPEDLHSQVPLVEEALRALGVSQLRVDRYEADDVIATLACACRAEGRECYIISSDKDLLQLVGGGVFQLRPGKAGPGFELVGEAEVKLEWSVEPAKVLDLLALTGDASDNVPGVRGIGDKTAVKLVARYGSLDGIYENIAGIEGSTGRKLAEGKESAYFSRKLIQLERNVALPSLDIETFTVESLDRDAGARALLSEGVRLVAQALSPAAVRAAEASGQRAEPPAPEKAQPGARPGDSRPAGAQSTAPRQAAQGGLFEGEAFATPPRPVATDELRATGSYRTILELEGLDALIARAREKKEFAFDFETDSLDAWNAKPFGFSFCVEPGEAFYIPVAPHGDPPSPFLDPAAVRDRIAVLFADPDLTVVAHNAKYDYEVARAWGIPRWRCRIWDTMVAAWLVDPERASYALDAIVAAWLGLETLPYSTVVPAGKLFGDVPLELATRYAGEDADYALRMKRMLEPCLVQAGEAGLFRDIEMPLLPILAEIEGAGIGIESDVLAAYGVELAEALVGIEAEIYELVGHEFNIASTKQLQEVLFVERKLKTGKKTKTGFSTDVAVLEELAREDPVPARILRYRTLAKLKSTYVDSLGVLAGPDGRIHSHFTQTGTATGRISSRDPNLQNIPIRDEEGRRIRSAFRASEGRILVSADYSQIELVVLAHLSGDPELAAAFRDGRDVHRRTAALIFGVSEDSVLPEQRRIAKTINFGVMYGMSAFRLANELDLTRTEAQTFIDAYFHTYAGVRAYIDALVAETEKRGYATTLLGRRRYIPAIASSNKTEKSAAERVAVNTPIQGSAADIVKLAMLRLDKALAASDLDARLLLQVHDELILECAESQAEEVMALAKSEMEKAASLRVPLRAGVEKGIRWGDMH